MISLCSEDYKAEAIVWASRKSMILVKQGWKYNCETEISSIWEFEEFEKAEEEADSANYSRVIVTLRTINLRNIRSQKLFSK